MSCGRVQHRTYEDGESYNQLYFEITDSRGDYIPVYDGVTDVRLYHPNGTLANISTITREPDFPIVLGGYNGDESNWHYDDPIQVNDYYGKDLDDLVPGQYRLVVTTDDG